MLTIGRLLYSYHERMATPACKNIGLAYQPGPSSFGRGEGWCRLQFARGVRDPKIIER
jgi:hypothetical protein